MARSRRTADGTWRTDTEMYLPTLGLTVPAGTLMNAQGPVTNEADDAEPDTPEQEKE